MKTTFALHSIKDTKVFSFDPDEYSRFKFGDNKVARRFGESLAREFIHQHGNELKNAGQLVVISSPYSFIPTATFAMKNYFVYELNHYLAENNLPVVQEAKINRTITYKEDYGELDAEKRIQLIGNDKFHIDASFLKDKTLIFLDDIRITGSHERMINKMIDEFALGNPIYLLYFARLDDMSIPPQIENYLNYFSVKQIFDLHEIVNNGDFAVNTRIVKYLLNYNTSDFEVFIEAQTFEFLSLIYSMALGNGYHAIDAYAKNLEILKEHVLRIKEKRKWEADAKASARRMMKKDIP